MTSEEDSAYGTIDFNVDDFRKSVGAKRLPTEDKKTLLIRRWREPRLVWVVKEILATSSSH